MRNVLKKLIESENKRFIFLMAIFVFSLMISAIIYFFAGQKNITNINYEIISTMKLNAIFIMNIKRNLIYFILLILLTIIGQNKIINILFGLVAVYYGLSVIYLIRTFGMDMKYFLMTFTDYFIFFPVLFYFTFISSTISKYTRKSKNIETISHKFDIIVTGYIKISMIYLFIVTVYSLGYSYYIYILSRLLVR
jgi:hypothetical protein